MQIDIDFYVLRGPCGVGKTHLRENSFLRDLPVIDMAEAPGNSFGERYEWLCDKVATTPTPAVIEAIFAPGTPSLKKLLTALKGRTFISITLSQSPKQVVKRIPAKDKKRREFLQMYANKFNF